MTKRKVHPIRYNLRVQHAKLRKAWLNQHEDEMTVFDLPSCSPELNSDEHLNGDVKAGVHSGRSARSNEQRRKRWYHRFEGEQRSLREWPGILSTRK